jgi:hypothetical protein
MYATLSFLTGFKAGLHNSQLERLTVLMWKHMITWYVNEAVCPIPPAMQYILP